MTNTSKTIIFFGTDTFSAPSLQRLIDDGYNVRAVVTKPDAKSGRGQKLTAPLVKQIAEQHGITVWQPSDLGEIIADVTAMQPVAGVLVSYGKIIPQTIIDLFTPGIINVHPSLLPHYRGSTPIETAIANGDTKSGVSIMQLTAQMDAGPVYGYSEVELNGQEDQSTLYATMAEAGATTLGQLLPLILDGSCQALPQDESKATFTKLLTKEDAWLMPDRLRAVDAERKVRAHTVFPKTKINVMGHDVIITKSHVVDHAESELDIACKDGQYLHIDELIAPSGRTMSGKDFLNGYAA